MSKISIIVPIYNVEKYLNKCIDSLINQTYKNIEIILINDGATDNSLKIAKGYKDDRIVLINRKNKGISYTRNEGIEKSTGEYIVFVDSDDWLELDAIENMYNEIKKCKVDMVRFNYQINNTPHTFKTVSDKDDLIKNILNGKIPAYVWLFIFKKKSLNDVRFKSDLAMMEDTTFIVELLSKNITYKMSNIVTYNYFLSEDSLSRGNKNYSRNIKELLKVNKYIVEIIKNNDYITIANTKHLEIIGLYLLKMHRDGININEIKKDFEFIQNNLQYIEITKNIDKNLLNKVDIKILEYIQKNQFEKMIKFFEKEEFKGVIEYKKQRIKNRIRGLIK